LEFPEYFDWDEGKNDISHCCVGTDPVGITVENGRIPTFPRNGRIPECLGWSTLQKYDEDRYNRKNDL
jgi:hypothetical protein